MAQQAKKQTAAKGNERVIAKFRQHYPGEEETTEYCYCLLLVSEAKKSALLSGNRDAADEVMVLFFNHELLLVGNGLCHEILFIEERDLVGQHKVPVFQL